MHRVCTAHFKSTSLQTFQQCFTEVFWTYRKNLTNGSIYVGRLVITGFTRRFQGAQSCKKKIPNLVWKYCNQAYIDSYTKHEKVFHIQKSTNIAREYRSATDHNWNCLLQKKKKQFAFEWYMNNFSAITYSYFSRYNDFLWARFLNALYILTGSSFRDPLSVRFSHMSASKFGISR